jgi:hypothetical protein
MAKKLSSSEVAAIITGATPRGTLKESRLGVILHERLSYHQWKRECGCLNTYKKFVRSLAGTLSEEGFPQEWIARAIRISATLIQAGVNGSTPKTICKEIKPGLFLFAKPDLIGDRIYEFKTYDPGKYAEAQAALFALAYLEPVVLVGVKEREDGMFDPVIKEIDPYPDVQEVAEIIQIHGEEFDENLFENKVPADFKYRAYIRELHDSIRLEYLIDEMKDDFLDDGFEHPDWWT